MPFPEAIVYYKDGSTVSITRASLAQNWVDMPIHNVDRIEFDPAYFGDSQSIVHTAGGGDAYWGYTEGANSFVFGVRTYEWLPPSYDTWDLTKPNYTEYVFDKRPNQPMTIRYVSGIPSQALVRYAD